jgi:subtilisin family serine protease
MSISDEPSPEASPESQRVFLNELLKSRQNPDPPIPAIALWPPNALDNERPPVDFYFYRPGELLVPSGQADAFVAAARALDLDPQPAYEDYVRPGPKEPYYVSVPIERLATSPTGAARFRVNQPIVERAIVDLKARYASLHVTPNHVVFGCQNWLMEPFGDPSMPAQGQQAAPGGGGQGIVVAVVDSGLPEGWTNNSLLRPVRTQPFELEPFSYQAPPATQLRWAQGHGSFVAGVVVQSAQAATVWSYRALDNVNSTDEWALGNQLADALRVGPPRVINLSLGAPTRANQTMLGLTALGPVACPDNARAPIIVAAAGNLDQARPFWPAADSWAISVGAAEWNGSQWQRASFSDFGKWVDVCAEGAGVCSSYPAQAYRRAFAPGGTVDFGGWAVWNGTSFAAPHVSGVIATLLAKKGNGGMGGRAVLAHLKMASTTVVPGIGSLVQ